MAGAGMATGGRVRHHLKHNISREECSVNFVGFAPRARWRGRSSTAKIQCTFSGRYPGESEGPPINGLMGRNCDAFGVGPLELKALPAMTYGLRHHGGYLGQQSRLDNEDV